MAGKGPPPQSRRARTNVQPGTTIIPFTKGEQPPLPDDVISWPDRTREWWEMWGRSDLAEQFIDADWDFLLDTALLHAAVWSGELDKLPELRLRVAKFGATPEDRARLRIQFAEADRADGGQPKVASARDRRGPLKSVG